MTSLLRPRAFEDDETLRARIHFQQGKNAKGSLPSRALSFALSLAELLSLLVSHSISLASSISHSLLVSSLFPLICPPFID